MGELYERVCDWENLLLAYRKAAKGKRGREPAARFEYYLGDQLVALRDEHERRLKQIGRDAHDRVG